MSAFHRSSRDTLLLALAATHGLLLILAPVLPVVALGVWWNSNTVSHNFIHRPFFGARGANRAFSLYLSLLLGVPQALWKQRHLAHHAGVAWRLRLHRQLLLECAAVAALWGLLATLEPRFFVLVYAPGYAAGLALCALHGHFEHARGATSHYGWLYNRLCFNDGYHIEHHLDPGAHWSALPRRARAAGAVSRWPPPLRWIESLSLVWLERLVLRSRRLQVFVLERHRRALRELLAELPPVGRVCIVGGGLFPRTALLLRELLPGARLTVVDASEENLRTAARFLRAGAERAGGEIEMVNRRYDPRLDDGADLLVVPLAYEGDKQEFYRRASGPAVLVHDWIWRRRGSGRLVSALLLKRLNRVGS
jgi:hypothetical protein